MAEFEIQMIYEVEIIDEEGILRNHRIPAANFDAAYRAVRKVYPNKERAITMLKETDDAVSILKGDK